MPTRKWGTEKLVNTTTTGSQSASDVAALTGGGYVVVWQDDGVVPPTIRFQRYDAAGNKVGAEVDIGVEFVGTDIEPSVIGLADGGFYVTWSNTSFDHIEGYVYNSNGTFVRYQPVIYTAGDQLGSDVAAFGAGSAIAWTDTNGNFDPDTEVRSADILLRTFDAAGTGSPIILVTDDGNDATDVEPSVASNGSRIAVVWSSRPYFGPDYDILCRIYDAAGTAITAQFAVNNPATTDDEGMPAVAWLASNRIVVAWRDGFAALPDNIRFRILDQNGNPITGELIANETTFDIQSAPAITALPNGNFVISWTDLSQTAPDTSGYAIRLQAFGASGTKIGGEIVVNTTTTSSQINPSVTALADSRVVVTWTDASDIRSQIIDPRDGIVNGGASGDTLYGHDSVGDEINGANGNDFAYGLAGSDTIYGGDGNDTLDGGRGDDTIFGGNNDDSIKGGLGDDELFGENGFDTIEGGAGADLIDGGDGSNDTASYFGAAGGVTVSLDGALAATGDAAGDTFAGVERLQGSNYGADILRGNEFANVISGFSGADTINASLGNDRIAGGAGIDTATGGLGIDRFEYNAQSEGGDLVTDFTAADDSFGFRGTAFGGLAPGAIAGANFVSRADNAAQDGNDFFIFRTTDKTLWFDVDGSLAAAPILIADLQASATMTSSDVVIF
jgi:Ca2+-binding RTX toxin-like protein